jgi:hypothetical protein
MQFARRDIVAEVQAASHSFERQTIYRCIRRPDPATNPAAPTTTSKSSATTNCAVAATELTKAGVGCQTVGRSRSPTSHALSSLSASAPGVRFPTRGPYLPQCDRVALIEAPIVTLAS